MKYLFYFIYLFSSFYLLICLHGLWQLSKLHHLMKVMRCSWNWRSGSWVVTSFLTVQMYLWNLIFADISTRYFSAFGQRWWYGSMFSFCIDGIKSLIIKSIYRTWSWIVTHLLSWFFYFFFAKLICRSTMNI